MTEEDDIERRVGGVGRERGGLQCVNVRSLERGIRALSKGTEGERVRGGVQPTDSSQAPAKFMCHLALLVSRHWR